MRSYIFGLKHVMMNYGIVVSLNNKFFAQIDVVQYNRFKKRRKNLRIQSFFCIAIEEFADPNLRCDHDLRAY